MSPRGGRRPVLRTLGLLGYVVLTTVALLEIGLRWLLPQPLPQPTPEMYAPDAEIGWRHTANARVIANTGERDVEICTDARGDRIDCASPPRDDDDCASNILVLGDSFVEALAVDFRDTVWGRIEREIGVCTHVAGVGGYGPQQYAALARERLRDRSQSFDLVIVNLYAGNDLINSATAMPGPERVSQPRVRLLPAGSSLQDLWNWLYPYNEWLESRSHLYVAMRFSLRRAFGYDDMELYGIGPALRPSRLSEAFLGETTRVVADIADEAQRASVPLLVVVIPIRNQVLDPHAEALRGRFPELGEDLDMNLVSERFVPRLDRLEGVDRVVDLLPQFRVEADAEAWGRRDSHFTATGHELWFEAIRGPVEELLARP